MGYRANPFEVKSGEDSEAQQSKFLLRCLAVSGFAAMNIMLLSVSIWSGNITDITPETRDLFHWLSAAIALPAAAYAGQPFFRSAFHALRSRQVNMDVPISLGIALALGMSLYETAHHAEHAYFDSAVMLIFFLLCGRVLDQIVRRRTRMVAGNLAALKADVAYRLLDRGELAQVPAAALKVGNRILVRAGERIPADGIVAGGHSEIDESLVTGETMPCKASSGRQVYAGSINLDGTLTIRVTAAGSDTFLDDIERLLEKAVHIRSRYVRLSDRIARCYAPMVHSAAALTLIGWLIAGASVHDALIAAISVLIITCPCALALAIPAVQVVAASTLFRSGIFLNSGDTIERLAEADTVIFDKTGTLTLPEPRIVNAGEIDPAMLKLAGRLALASRHPLAAAIARHQQGLQTAPNVFEERGRGVRATIDGVEARLGSASFCENEFDDDVAARYPGASMIAFRYGKEHAVFAVHQALRPQVSETLRALRELGLDIHILSGDRAAAVEPVANGLCVRQWQAGLRPADKVRIIDSLEGRRPQGADGRRRPERRAVACHRQCLDVADQRRRSLAGAGRRRIPRREPHTGAFGGARGAPGAHIDASESVARDRIQCDRGTGRDGRTGDATDRCRRDVGIVGAGHPQCAARTNEWRTGRPTGGRRRNTCGAPGMNVLIYLVPMALSLGLAGLFAFLWSLKAGQYDDLDGAALRILDNEDLTEGQALIKRANPRLQRNRNA